MKEGYRFILDMDGTLYRFDKGQSDTFTSSQFYTDLRNHIYDFIVVRRNISHEKAVEEYQRIKDKYEGEVSLGIEVEFGINRYEYFSETWGKLEPLDYIEASCELPKVLEKIQGKAILLTSAPRVWSLKVLKYLGINEIFENAIYTGEPDIRKPNPAIFQRIADDLDVSPEQIFSIGDQEESDIAPARSIGMKTIHIGFGETNANYQASDIKQAIEILKKEGLL